MRFPTPLFFLFLSTALVSATPDPEKKPDKPEKSEVAAPAPVVRNAEIVIDGNKIPYSVSTGKLQLKQNDGKSRASIFHVSYERTDVKDVSSRPVMFAFNGGPGSSAVWLHIGALGPRIIHLPGDGTQAPMPPIRVEDNPLSILDVCDLVFVDPVSTGYSRAENEGKPADFHGVREDVESVGDFIRRWITEHGRWASPKYLLGESYGGVRVAGLSQHLQSRYGMSLNGVVLMSSLLDFAALQTSAGNDLGCLTYLPSFTGVAHFHKKIKGDRDALIKESADFAFGEYATALLKGNALGAAERKPIATKLARLTGIPAEVWLAHDLRIGPSLFRAELMRAEGKVIGRFDARVSWDTTEKTSQSADFDPSYSLAYGAFSSAMMDYLGTELGYKEDQPYEILTGVGPWRWNAENQIVNVSDNLSTAMRDNPHLRVLVMGGRTDLATPPEGVAYSFRHMLDMPESARGNITTTRYEGGHMFYLNSTDLAKARKDLLAFIRSGKP
ncbi:MAG: peptidase S10 [Verrucomicrobiota bacterium]